jgi:hypothetical protein
MGFFKIILYRMSDNHQLGNTPPNVATNAASCSMPGTKKQN